MMELKRCPFCGGEAELHNRPVYTCWQPYSPETAKRKHYAQCTSCHTQCGFEEYDAPDLATEAWNRRVEEGTA